MPPYARLGHRDPSRLLCGGAENTCGGQLAEVRQIRRTARLEPGGPGPGQLVWSQSFELIFSDCRLEGDLVLARRRPRRPQALVSAYRASDTGLREEHPAVRWPLKIQCPRCHELNLIDPERLETAGPLERVVTTRPGPRRLAKRVDAGPRMG